MTYAYRIEVFPDHEKLGLKRLVGHVNAYFDSIPTKAKALEVILGARRKLSKLDKKYMYIAGGMKMVSENAREHKIFYKAVESIIREVDVPKDSFDTPKWQGDMKDLSREEKSIATVSFSAKDGRLYLSRVRVWSGK